MLPDHPAIADERRRIVELIQAHKADIPSMVLNRLLNLISMGVDLQEEMAVPLEDRIGFMHWADGSTGPGGIVVSRRRKRKPRE